ncbi:MAG: right-handed parallel beta-helix repeat-containing protein [Acidobacteria bacterium]|nr:right-handed parallel beta-helix repeat-containing protein [Acidobacteriota bacterium]
MNMKRLVMACAAILTLTTTLAAANDGKRVPFSGIIDSPGNYVLQSDLRSLNNDRAAITITANDVTVDLNGLSLTGAGGKLGVGIMINGAQGVRVSNGMISKSAFGVIVMNSSNVALTNLQIRGEGLPIVSLPPETGVMIVQSTNVVVEQNSIHNTGLGIFVRGGMSTGNRIANNTLTAGTNGVLGICYNPTAADANGPVGDLVYGNSISGFGVGIQASTMSRYNVFKGNTIFFNGSSAMELLNDTNMDMDNTKVDLAP